MLGWSSTRQLLPSTGEQAHKGTDESTIQCPVHIAGNRMSKMAFNSSIMVANLFQT